MICPTCHIALQPSRDPNGAIWLCDGCAGAAANLAVLRKRLQTGMATEFWRQVLAGSTASTKPCPSCNGSMRAFKVSVNEHETTLDLCKKCQIVWFDAGELEAMPKAIRPEDDIPPEIRKQIALFEIQQEQDLKAQLNYDTMRFNRWIDVFHAAAYILIRLALRR